MNYACVSPAELQAMKQDIFMTLRCALPGNVISFDSDTQTAEIRPALKIGSLEWPVLTGVPVFMPVPFEVKPGDACLVVFADFDIDAWMESGRPETPRSSRRHALSDGFAFVGFRTGNGDGESA